MQIFNVDTSAKSSKGSDNNAVILFLDYTSYLFSIFVSTSPDT